MSNLKTAIATLIIVAFFAATAMAEPPKTRRGFGPPKDPEKAREHFEMLTMWRMMDALDLDKTTGQNVFEIRRRFNAERKALVKELGQELETLRTRIQDEKAPPDEKELNRIIKNVRDKRKRLETLQDQQYDEISKVLTVVQQAKLLVFMKDFQDEIRAFIHRPPPPPPPPPGGPPPPGPGPGGDPFASPTDF